MKAIPVPTALGVSTMPGKTRLLWATTTAIVTAVVGVGVGEAVVVPVMILEKIVVIDMKVIKVEIVEENRPVRVRCRSFEMPYGP